MTIYDIAKEAGVAASTVSRVINNKPGIKTETRERVQELLKKYNYIPNEAARGLVMQSSKIIGILVADIRVTHHIEGVHYIEQKMTERGYCCITMSTGPGDEKKAEYIRILEQRRVEGAILMGSMFVTEKVKQSIAEHMPGVPVVMVNGYLDLPNVYGVLVDEQEGIEQCTDLLLEKGKKKLAFVLDAYSPSNVRKRQGFMTSMLRHGWKQEELWLYEMSVSSMDAGYDITVAIAKEHPDIQGIVYSIDLVAVGGIRALHDRGFKVPEEVAVVGVDNSIYGRICMPMLTTLDNKLQELSETAAHILIGALTGEKQSKKLMLFSEIIEREST